jgi:hypothetical protein
MRYLIAVVLVAGCGAPMGAGGGGSDAGGGVEKIPHLIVTATGEDLGPFVEWDLAWNGSLPEPYRVDNVVTFVYESNDCSGVPMVDQSPLYPYFIGPGFTIFRLDTNVGLKTVASGRNRFECSDPIHSNTDKYTVIDTKIMAQPHTRSELSVALR